MADVEVYKRGGRRYTNERFFINLLWKMSIWWARREIGPSTSWMFPPNRIFVAKVDNTEARLPAGWGRASYWVSAFGKLCEVGLIHWTTKISGAIADGKRKKRRPTFSLLRTDTRDMSRLFKSSTRLGTCGVKYKYKYERTKYSMQRENERTGEAWIEAAKIVNATKRLRLERKCIFRRVERIVQQQHRSYVI